MKTSVVNWVMGLFGEQMCGLNSAGNDMHTWFKDRKHKYIVHVKRYVSF